MGGEGMKLTLPKAVWQVMERLNHCGYEAFAVGGCVRDRLLGKQPKDWDVCTSALPEQIIHCFQDMRTLPTGLQHGTVTVISGHTPVEVTTFRIDGQYSDNRHPDGVTFTSSLREDLSRRDFTVNAMAYHPAEGLVDWFGGQADLAAGVIRCVGDPFLRFREDALRILRGLRFASVLDFSIEDTTCEAIRAQADLLSHVAKERVFQELSKLICGRAAAGIITRYASLLEQAMPYFRFSRETAEALSSLPSDALLRFAALYYGNENAAMAMRQLRAPKGMIEGVALLAQARLKEPVDSLPAMRKIVFSMGMERAGQTLQLMKAFGRSTKEAEACLQEIRDRQLCCSLKELAVSGNDLMQAGFPAGQALGRLLEGLLFAVMEERVPNEKDPLLTFAASL